MSSLGSFFKYAFLVLFTVLLAGQLAAVVLLQSASGVALDPAFYKNELEKSGAYDMIYAKLNAAIAEQGGAQATALLSLSGVTVNDIVTKTWIKAAAGHLIDNALAYVKGQSATADLTVDLTEPKANLYAAAQAKIVQLPQGAQDAATAKLAEIKTQFDEKVPDRIDLAATPGTDGLDQAKSAVTTFQTALLGLLVLSLVWAGLIVFLARQSVNSILRWLGAALLLGGLLAFGILSFAQSMLKDALKVWASLPESASLSTVAADGMAAVNNAAFPLAAALAVIGAIGLAASVFLKPGASDPAPAAAGMKRAKKS